MTTLNSRNDLGGGSVPKLDIPNTDAAADLPRKDRVSARKMSAFIRTNYEEGLSVRLPHARAWRMVRSIMHEVHYFSMRGGVLRPLRADPTGRKVRAVAPIMKPSYRQEGGFLNSNQIGVTVTPKPGDSRDQFYKAKRGQAIMEDWMDVVDIAGVHDEHNMQLSYYGMSALYRYTDRFRKQVFVKAVPQTQLMPIPFDANSIDEADGLMRMQIVTRQWLEQQDARLEAKGVKPARLMAKEASAGSMKLTDHTIGISSYDNPTGSMEGALAINFWIKPNEQNPSGQWGLMINDTLYRYASGYDENGDSIALANGTKDRPGRLPFELVYHTKVPDDFWGYGSCEALIALQRERNRQLSALVQNARDNKPITVFDTQSVSPGDIMNDESLLIPARSFLDGGRPPLWHVPAQPSNPNAGSLLAIVGQFAKEAINQESPILAGEQSKRTEGGPATSLLNANANMPMQTVVDRQWRAWHRTFPEVLDMLKNVWPDNRIVRSTGQGNIGKEFAIKREDVPWSRDIFLSPTPMIAGGRNAMIQMLFTLRGMPSDDGKGAELKGRELRKSLRMMGVNPPGLEMADPEVQQMEDWINIIVNDTQTPGVQQTAMEGGQPQLAMMNHSTMIDMLREKILDPAFESYSQAVKKALMDQIEFHKNRLQPIHPDSFDDHIEDQDAQASEDFLLAAENDLGGYENQVQLNGVPLGTSLEK